MFELIFSILSLVAFSIIFSSSTNKGIVRFLPFFVRDLVETGNVFGSRRTTLLLSSAVTIAALFSFNSKVQAAADPTIKATNYNMTVKKYEDNDTDDMVTKAIMLVDGKVVDVNSLVVIAKA